MSIIFVLEIIGTIAFAISGACRAMKNGMDIFGVAVLGMTTAVGGGIIRDLILGITPPMAFRNPVYAIVAIIVSILVFLTGVETKVNEENRIVLLMDDLGLGIFTVVGVRAGMAFDNAFLSVFVGVLTGVGGGILRDLFAGKSPSIFNEHFYASASMIGAAVSVILWKVEQTWAMMIGLAVIVVLRLLAARFRWDLPNAKKKEGQ